MGPSSRLLIRERRRRSAFSILHIPKWVDFLFRWICSPAHRPRCICVQSGWLLDEILGPWLAIGLHYCSRLLNLFSPTLEWQASVHTIKTLICWLPAIVKSVHYRNSLIWGAILYCDFSWHWLKFYFSQKEDRIRVCETVGCWRSGLGWVHHGLVRRTSTRLLESF